MTAIETAWLVFLFVLFAAYEMYAIGRDERQARRMFGNPDEAETNGKA